MPPGLYGPGLCFPTEPPRSIYALANFKSVMGKKYLSGLVGTKKKHNKVEVIFLPNNAITPRKPHKGINMAIIFASHCCLVTSEFICIDAMTNT